MVIGGKSLNGVPELVIFAVGPGSSWGFCWPSTPLPPQPPCSPSGIRVSNGPRWAVASRYTSEAGSRGTLPVSSTSRGMSSLL